MITSERLKDSYFLLVILFSGMATAFFRSMEGLIFLLVLGVIVFYKPTTITSKKLVIALLVWSLYFLINTLIIKSFHPYFYGTYVAKVFIAYWLVSYFKDGALFKYERIIYKLSVLSLVFYAIQLIIPVQLYHVLNIFDFSGNLFPNIKYANIGFYTFHQRSFSEFFPRNSGFAWEPGPFSCYIALAIFFNIARNKATFNDKKTLGVFVLALITTQSTTGFLVLLVICLWYAWSRYKNKIVRVISVPIALSIVMAIFFSVPFLQEKITENSKQSLDDIIAHAEITGSSYAPGRFVGWQLRWEDFKNYPLAGFGGSTKLQYGYLGEGNVVAAINGLGTILGRYGAIGAFFFFFLLFQFGKYHAQYYNYSGLLIFPIVILIVGFSFGIIETPIIITFLLFPFFIKKHRQRPVTV